MYYLQSDTQKGTLYHTTRLLMTLKKKAFENILGKRENAGILGRIEMPKPIVAEIPFELVNSFSIFNVSRYYNLAMGMRKIRPAP